MRSQPPILLPFVPLQLPPNLRHPRSQHPHPQNPLSPLLWCLRLLPILSSRFPAVLAMNPPNCGTHYPSNAWHSRRPVSPCVTRALGCVCFSLLFRCNDQCVSTRPLLAQHTAALSAGPLFTPKCRSADAPPYVHPSIMLGHNCTPLNHRDSFSRMPVHRKPSLHPPACHLQAPVASSASSPHDEGHLRKSLKPECGPTKCLCMLFKQCNAVLLPNRSSAISTTWVAARAAAAQVHHCRSGKLASVPHCCTKQQRAPCQGPQASATARCAPPSLRMGGRR